MIHISSVFIPATELETNVVGPSRIREELDGMP